MAQRACGREGGVVLRRLPLFFIAAAKSAGGLGGGLLIDVALGLVKQNGNGRSSTTREIGVEWPANGRWRRNVYRTSLMRSCRRAPHRQASRAHRVGRPTPV